MSREDKAPWRDAVYQIIFEADTRAGKLFDIGLVVAIVLSVIVVMLDSVANIHVQWGHQLFYLEWFFSIVFTLEYIARIVSVNKPANYIFSFMGIIDLLSTLPSYIALFMSGASYAMALRLLRLLRIFRILKLSYYLEESEVMARALAASRRKLLVFLLAILTLVVILGTLMFVVEGPENGYTSIPESVYWAIVTLTTVGYGDISPKTPVGQAIASMVMIMGYAIIAVPTGIVTVELARSSANSNVNVAIACPSCMLEGHEKDAVYCRHCGEALLAHDY
ncbi:cyclic nucleotide-gated potassium channel [mine drainage metagenome]|uniref:Cyclic nucleotide-gated potassium channel n=1 Tax=mine drainage metagenome TaxID=410659 RepID=A0A1J5S8T2_9ZZZZ